MTRVVQLEIYCKMTFEALPKELRLLICKKLSQQGRLLRFRQFVLGDVILDRYPSGSVSFVGVVSKIVMDSNYKNEVLLVELTRCKHNTIPGLSKGPDTFIYRVSIRQTGDAINLTCIPGLVKVLMILKSAAKLFKRYFSTRMPLKWKLEKFLHSMKCESLLFAL